MVGSGKDVRLPLGPIIQVYPDASLGGHQKRLAVPMGMTATALTGRHVTEVVHPLDCEGNVSGCFHEDEGPTRVPNNW